MGRCGGGGQQGGAGEGGRGSRSHPDPRISQEWQDVYAAATRDGGWQARVKKEAEVLGVDERKFVIISFLRDHIVRGRSSLDH